MSRIPATPVGLQSGLDQDEPVFHAQEVDRFPASMQARCPGGLAGVLGVAANGKS